MPIRMTVVRARRAVLEVHLHAEHVAAGGIELELVVVAEPVKLRTARDGAHRRQLFRLRQRGGRNSAGQGLQKDTSRKHWNPQKVYFSPSWKDACRRRPVMRP